MNKAPTSCVFLCHYILPRPLRKTLANCCHCSCNSPFSRHRVYSTIEHSRLDNDYAAELLDRFFRRISSNQPPSSEPLDHNLSPRRRYHPAYLSHIMGVLFYNSRVVDSTNFSTHVEPITKPAKGNEPASNLLSALPEELKLRILHLVRLTRV